MKFAKKKKKKVPWMVGYNFGCVLYVVVGVCRRDADVVIPDATPHVFNIIFYATLLESKAFGMMGAFQILLESGHIFNAPLALLGHLRKIDTTYYFVLEFRGVQEGDQKRRETVVYLFLMSQHF
ncbi:hypothetical protein RFI_22350 [Reticulomyxa filosa]|uniref:Uncharacterized protein n=1 Tax=Reticulomyxa filosa TaxID=46433 RepID=X6MPK3_RETFI|nr:hypothetical protein RFI_22350 [Reticulomyxa filosa]|eukprot:ETO15015.1 hypothetical protein RFI_22350 [Reticulomyxa filosa]